MSNEYGKENDQMIELFIFETNQLLDQLEQIIIKNEDASKSFSSKYVEEIFRIVHTVKGSSSMMMVNNISELSHSVEDLFDLIRVGEVIGIDYHELSDILLDYLDFVRGEIKKLQMGLETNGDIEKLKTRVSYYCSQKKKPLSNDSNENQEEISSIDYDVETDDAKLKSYSATIFFEQNSEMENVRAYGILSRLKGLARDIKYYPADIMKNNNTTEIIKKQGFKLSFKTDLDYSSVKNLFEQALFIKSIILKEESKKEIQKRHIQKDDKDIGASMISVYTYKLNILMDLVGELVVSEALVTQNPELSGLTLDSFYKNARQLRKTITELQDIAMSLRMTPLTATFQRMKRIVRDMSRKLSKEITLELIGEETEVDKNVVESLTDPLMHLIRNAVDHGIEGASQRIKSGKPEKGKITLEAKNVSSEVWISIKDDGKGIDKEKVLKKAKEKGLVKKADSEIIDKEIYSYILLPGFSTKDVASEFSGRGVGMDVVCKAIEKVGGSVSVDSVQGEGTEFKIKIPLTLTIFSGMIVRVGSAFYTIPIKVINECLRIGEDDVIKEINGKETIMLRGKCFPVMRIHSVFDVDTNVKDFKDGIFIVIERERNPYCIFVDELIGEHQVVVKPLPHYIKKVNGLAGCTILGDGNISLILDTETLA